MSELKYCRVEDEGRLRIVTLNRPEVMNALHSEAHFELEKVWDEFAANPDLWVAIVTGAGDRAFSAGNDLKVQAAGKRGPTPRMRPIWSILVTLCPASSGPREFWPESNCAPTLGSRSSTTAAPTR